VSQQAPSAEPLPRERGTGRPKILVAIVCVLALDLLRTASRLVAQVSSVESFAESGLFLLWLPTLHILLLCPAVFGLWRLAVWGGYAAIVLVVLRSGQSIWFATTFWNDVSLGTRAPMEVVNASFYILIGIYLAILLRRRVLSR
jgi:hypothetical protein